MNKTSFIRYYRILDFTFCLQTDSRPFLENFDFDYGFFGVSRPANNDLPIFSVLLYRKKPFIRFEGETISLEGYPDQHGLATQRLIAWILDNIQGYFLLHAAVAAYREKAVILSGPPGIGKTTQVIDLVQSGFLLYSDDFCPIQKNTGMVYPFPRGVWVCSDSPYAKKNPARTWPAMKPNKSAFRPDNLIQQTGTKPCSIGCLICLDPDIPTETNRRFLIAIKKGYESPVLTPLKDIAQAKFSGEQEHASEWILEYPSGEKHGSRIREIVENNREFIWVFRRLPSEKHDFSKEPVLTTIPVHEAVFHVMEEQKQTSPFPDENKKGWQSRRFMELIHIMEKTPCYRLKIGKRKAMNRLIQKAAGFEENP